MFRFDIDNMITVRYQLKRITTALGGSMMVVDEYKSTDHKQVLKKIDVPFAVARTFIKATGNHRQYFSPIEIEALFYGDDLICIERSPFKTDREIEHESLFGVKRQWTSNISKNIDRIADIVFHGDWYFDGKYIFKYQDGEEFNGKRLDRDGYFRRFVVDAINTQRLYVDRVNNKDGEVQHNSVESEKRVCVAFITKNNKSVIVPPVWKNFDVGNRQMAQIGGEVDDGDDDSYHFDRLDENVAVNLNFVLKAAKDVSAIFGYKSIEPLALDDLMVELCTVNLPNVNNNIKATYDCHLPFTHALAWLIGKLVQTDNLTDYSLIRQDIKYLTTKGIFRREAFENENIWRDGHHSGTVPFIENVSAA